MTTLAGSEAIKVFLPPTVGNSSGGYIWVTAQDIANLAGAGSGRTRQVIPVSEDTEVASAPLTDYVYLCSGTITMTLAPAAGNINLYSFKNVGTGVITLSGTVDGSTNIALNTGEQSLDIISNNSSYNIL